MWCIELTHSWLNSAPRYLTDKSEPETAALFLNLQRYRVLLKASKSSKSVEALYLHKLPSSVVAIDQAGISAEAGDLRIYTFADDSKQTLYLLGVGKVTDENADMEYYRNLVYTLINTQQ